MKTTVELPDALLSRSGSGQGFVLRDASVPGQGLHPDVAQGGWKRIAMLGYEGRGG